MGLEKVTLCLRYYQSNIMKKIAVAAHVTRAQCYALQNIAFTDFTADYVTQYVINDNSTG